MFLLWEKLSETWVCISVREGKKSVYTPSRTPKSARLPDLIMSVGGGAPASCSVSRFLRSYTDSSPWQISLKSLLSISATRQELTDSSQETELGYHNQISTSFNFCLIISQEKRNCLFFNFTILSYSCLIHTIVLISRLLFTEFTISCVHGPA